LTLVTVLLDEFETANAIGYPPIATIYNVTKSSLAFHWRVNQGGNLLLRQARLLVSSSNAKISNSCRSVNKIVTLIQ